MVAPPAEVVEGRMSIEAYWQAGLAAGMTNVELEPFDLEWRDSFAYELGRYELLLDGDDGPVVDRGTYMVVHERQPDGTWLRAAEMFNTNGSPTVETEPAGTRPHRRFRDLPDAPRPAE